MKRTDVKLLRKRIRNLIVLAILTICLILVYKMYPQSKSEKIITTNITFVEELTNQEISVLTNSDDFDDNGYYTEMPLYVKGLHVIKYSVADSTKTDEDGNPVVIEYYPGDKYYFTEEDINTQKMTFDVVYDTKESQKDLYYKKLETRLEQTTISIDGYMPKDAEIVINVANFKNTEDKIKAVNEKLDLAVAYDIKIMSNGEKYEPNNFDENVKVTIAGIVDKENPTGLKVMHIDDNDKVEEIKSISIEEENLSFNAESFSVYAIVSVQSGAVTLPNSISVWDGSIATGYSWGEGTATNPYLIATGSELAYLASQVNNASLVDDEPIYSGTHFKLINNIDLNNNPWTPIGTTDNSFGGVFDGQGFSILNTTITCNGNTNGTIYSYGIFGSLSGTDTNRAIIKNVQFDNIELRFIRTANIVDTIGYKFGIVSGAMYRYATIQNVIVKNSSVTHNATEDKMWISGGNPIISIGGIVGEASYSSNDRVTEVTEGRYVIDNCYSDVDINIFIGVDNATRLSGIGVGGVIGKISKHSVWPTNCLYNGTITTTSISSELMMTGPIFGGETTGTRNVETTLEDVSSYIWNGNTDSTITSYYTNYTVLETSFTSTCTNGTTPQSQPYRIYAWWWAYTAGVNKGIYTSDMNSRLSAFNTNAANAGLSRWTYTNNNFNLVPGLDLRIDETAQALYTFTITPTSALATPEYNYQWYVNGTLDTTRTTNVSTFQPSFAAARTVKVIVTDGTYVALAQFNLAKLTLGLNITENNGTLSATLTGSGASFVSINDFNINWYEIDVVEGKGNTPIATTLTYSGIQLYHEYQLELSSGAITYEGLQYPLTATYVYGNRNIIYVNNVGYNINNTNYVGNNNNNGTTPQTAVKTLTRAYELINTNVIEGNVIVIMGAYNDNDYLDVRSGNPDYTAISQRFDKPALITGKLKGQVYNADLNFQCNDSIYYGKYLFADTRFEYITFNGKNSRTFLYLQGHNITMGKSISMINYSLLDAGDFGQIRNLNSPAFSMFCGFHNYNYSTIPDNSKVSNVLIQSGTYGRILAGCRNNTGAVEVITTSHNIFGAPGDHFTCNITIDYINPSPQNATKPDVNLLVAGSTDGNMYCDSTLNIRSGKVGRILGGNIGSNTVEFNNYPINLFIGSTTINISGENAAVTEIFGGSLGRWTGVIYYYGNIEINITNGSISRNIYGAGAASITGNNINKSYDYYSGYASGVTTSVAINISGGTVNGDIYGGGYGYSQYLTEGVESDGGSLYGNSLINISGGTINGNIYGAGRGYYGQNYEKENLAQMIGNSTITISGTPTITGDIYGAGEGISGHDGIAKLIGNSTININAPLNNNNIYGGGNIAKLEGTSTINMQSSGTNTHATKGIYGGGKQGEIIGNTVLNVTGGTYNNVYGGGELANIRNSEINITGGATTNVYGGGNEASAENSEIHVTGGTTANIYAGGNQAGVGITEVYLEGGTATSIFGGSNSSGTVSESNVILQSGTVTDVYGGNNHGGNTVNSNVYIYGGTISGNVYGGGNQATTATTNVYLKNTPSITGNVSNGTGKIFGGGNQAGVSVETNVFLENGAVPNVFGGSNSSGTVTKSNIYIGNEPQHIHAYVYTQNDNSTHNKSCTCGELTENEPCVDNNLDNFCDLCGYEIQSYTITYNANNGLGGPSTQTKLLGRDLQISNLTPTRNNYVFGGWSTNSGATESTYKPGDLFTTDANTTLYAVWENKRTYSYQRATSITSGEKYLIVFNGANAMKNTYKATGGGLDGLGYENVSVNNNIITRNEGILSAEWTFTSSGEGYLISNVANGQYLNLSTSGNANDRYARLTTTQQVHNVPTASNYTNEFRIGYQNGSSLDKHPSGDGDCFCTYPNGSNTHMQLYRKIYPTMSGTTSYTYQQQAGNEINILNNIKANTTISENLNGTVSQKNWQSHYVTYTWDRPFNSNSIGTYILSVFYDGIKLGEVTVNITVAQNVNVATITADGGTTTYQTVQAAINACETETRTVKLIADCVQNITIGAAQDITLDLNGKTISYATTTITNNGNLTVTDNTAGGTGRIVCTTSSNAYYPIKHSGAGTLTLNKGNLDGAYRGMLIENNSATFIMNGGSITGRNGSGITTTSSASVDKFEMNGGTITSSSYGVYLYRATDVKITDGIINGQRSALYVGSNITIDIGKQDGTVNATPALRGASNNNYAVQAPNCTINFYDGVLRGVPVAYNATLGAIEGGAVISTSTETISGITYNVARVQKQYLVQLPTNSTPPPLVVTNVYGGNDSGGSTTESNIIGYGGTITNVYGGGNNVDAAETNILINSGTYTNIYGGSNASGTVTETHVNIFGGTITNAYGGNNSGGYTTTSNITLTDGTVTNIFGGNDRGGTTTNTNVIINGGTVNEVYGGNNEGGTTTNATTTTNNGTIGNVFGGGYRAATDNVVLNISSPISRNVYGGGNQAAVNNNTVVNLVNATVGNSVYGGGNEGVVTGNASVNVRASEITESVYGGGNGASAVVNGNTTLVLKGSTIINENAFGGGNQAATGISPNTTSISTVNIVGATIGGNVYGGANQSNIYGSTIVNIGNSGVPNISDLQPNDINIITITGSVFGGGERSLGFEDYQSGIYSVTAGVEINIDADRNVFNTLSIGGSIFGSGNKVNSSGTSNVNIKNYGIPGSPKTNKSIQRASTVVLDNSSMWILGANDSTNKYVDTNYSLSRIGEFKLKNNSVIYLKSSTNLLEKLSSVVDNGGTEQKGWVTINNGIITSNVNNRIYMLQGVNLNVAKNETVTDYGDVYGMAFLGLYTGYNLPTVGIYSDSYTQNDEINQNDLVGFYSTSYVLAKHQEDTHDITVDGFYTNYEEESEIEGAPSTIRVDYITPIPDNQSYYMWKVGKDSEVKEYNIELTASKYNTLGIKKLRLTDFTSPGAIFEYSGIICDFPEGVELIDRDDINDIETDETRVHTKFGLKVATRKTGWSEQASSYYYSSPINDKYYEGDTVFVKDSEDGVAPILNFNLYHAQNITENNDDVGTANLFFTAIQQPEDPDVDPNKRVTPVIIHVKIKTNYSAINNYEVATAPGEYYEAFGSDDTYITNKSEFSQYYSLQINNFDTTEYFDTYDTNHRTLVSSTTLPENTIVTMMDLTGGNTSEYYYYTVPTGGVTEINIADFKKMGTTGANASDMFDEDNDKYYNSTTKIQNEKFIFKFDFSNAVITTDIVDETILLAYRDKEDETLISVWDDLTETFTYSVYVANSDIQVGVDPMEDSSIYLGEELELNINTIFNKTRESGRIIEDTKYFKLKPGIKITVYTGEYDDTYDYDTDPNLKQVTGSSLLGVYYEWVPLVEGTSMNYYPRADGTTRIRTAGIVGPVSTNLKIHTENSSLATGDYTIRVEAFASPDGIYYGLESNAETFVDISVANSIYGLSVDLENDNMAIIESETGKTQHKTAGEERALKFDIEYSSGLANPNIRVGLYRRDYTNQYSNTYNLVDLGDYVTNALTESNINDIYNVVTQNLTNQMDFDLVLKNPSDPDGTELVTGTYKVVFSLYDGDTKIGEVYEYIVIN